MLLHAAVDGRGIVMYCRHTGDTALCSGQLVPVLPDYSVGEFPIVALYPHRQYVSAKVRSFVDSPQSISPRTRQTMHGAMTV